MTPNWSGCVLLVVGLVGLIWAVGRCQHRPAHRAAITARVQRLLQPRTPDDCPACRQQAAPSTGTAPARPPVTPWCMVKSRRGAPNRMCIYYQIADAQIHAPLWRWSRRESGTQRDVALPGLPDHLQHAPPYAALSAENPIPPSCRSADGPDGRPGCLRGRARVQASACDHHHLAHTCRRAQRQVARPLLSEPPSATCATGRTAE
jgi:hypothetical protein